MSSGLLPRVCAFGVPGQGKTHGYPGFENDVEDLVTDVPAAFCVPEVFVDATMIASDSWVAMIGDALSAFDDAAMLFVFRSSSFMKFDGFWGRFLVSSGLLRIVVNSGSFCLVSPCGFMAVRVLGVFAEIGGGFSCDFGVIAELNGGRYCVPGQSQAADLLCSGQCCDLFDHQDTHFSALSLGLLPVHTIVSDGARGFAGSLEHVAAAASGFSGHSDLLICWWNLQPRRLST